MIVEDGAFVGSRCIVVEGVRVGREAVLGAGVVLTASTPIVDVRGSEPVITKGAIPPRAVVIPGTLPKRFPAGEFGTPCALIIGERSESTDQKTSLNAALREYEVAVYVNPRVAAIEPSLIREIAAKKKPGLDRSRPRRADAAAAAAVHRRRGALGGRARREVHASTPAIRACASGSPRTTRIPGCRMRATSA